MLTEDTGHVRDYGVDPYGSYNPPSGYYRDDSSPMFPVLYFDDRYLRKRSFIGVRTAEAAAAVERSYLREVGILEVDLRGDFGVLLHDSTLDVAYAYRRPENEEVLLDADSGTVATRNGTYPVSEVPFDPLVSMDVMWFGWIGFYPSSAVYGSA